MLATVRKYTSIAHTMWHMPRARLQFRRSINPDNVPRTYRHFTRPHPRYRIIGHKTVGAALVDLGQFSAPDQYLARIGGRNFGAELAARARHKGYRVVDIDRDAYADEIHAINTSLEQRQGRPMDAHYLLYCARFEREPNFRYTGVLAPDGRLMAYGNVGEYGDFAAFSQLMGFRNNHGIMHLLVVETVLRLLAEGRVRYLMYDTFFGASEGLQRFKRMLGFQPYWVHYELAA